MNSAINTINQYSLTQLLYQLFIWQNIFTSYNKKHFNIKIKDTRVVLDVNNVKVFIVRG
jgi:hypothetical protein